MRSVASAASGGAAKPVQIGKYALLGAIGRGGMADVYLAVAHGPSGVRKLVVVKCMRAGSELDTRLAQMFLEEGRLAALLNHANVVHTYEVGQGEDGLYIVMEYLHGQALSAIQRAARPLPPRIAVRIAADALSGLHYVHELRDLDGTPLAIVHRDLSPPNIFVTHDGVVKLVDFGIAKTAIATRASTEAGIVKGKLAYMAPEQTTSGSVDRRTDIYAMGVVLWELLAGRRLVEDLSPVSIVRNTLHGSTPLVSSVRAEIDPALDRIVERALRRDPEARYATAREMEEDLEDFLAQGPATGSKDLSQLMAEHFSAQREQREQQIQSWVAAFTPERSEPIEPATDGEPLPRAPSVDQTLGALSTKPLSKRLSPLSPQQYFRGALIAGALLLGFTTFALVSSQHAPTNRAAAAGPAPAIAASPSESKPEQRLEVATHPSLAAASATEPNPPLANSSAPPSRSAPLRKPSNSPRSARLLDAAPVNGAAPVSSAPTVNAPLKMRGNAELEHNPYLHSE